MENENLIALLDALNFKKTRETAWQLDKLNRAKIFKRRRRRVLKPRDEAKPPVKTLQTRF